MKFKKDPQRKKRPKKKPRSIAHTFVFNASHVNPDTERIEMDYHFNMSTGETYSVINGEKVLPDGLSMSYSRPGKTAKEILRFEDTGTTNNFALLLKKFDLLIAIDTNTSTIGGVLHHVSFCIQAILNDDKKVSNVIPLNHNFVLMGNYYKPENRNIRSLIEFIKISTFSQPNMNIDDLYIGIITDTDLINISAINKRKMPLIEDYYLPNNIELIFASDATSDTIFNQLIRWCHKYSNFMINEARPELEKLMTK